MKTNKELINKLKQGHIAIDNSGNPNVELLRAVLKEAFPSFGRHVNGIYKYYFINRFESRYFDFNDFNSQKLPTIPLNDFLEKEQFPKDDFGVIVENNNGKEIIDYLVSKGFENISLYSGNSWDGCSYGIKKHSKKIDNWGLSNILPSKTYTLQQLKNLENNMENKEIIGYKLIKPEYEKAARGIAVGCFCKFTEIFSEDVKPIRLWKEAGILDIWFEPVYKSKEVVIRMGNSFDLTIKDGQVWHKSDNITDFVTRMMVDFSTERTLKFGGYNLCIKDITFKYTGCQNVETKLSEWIAVYNELQKQK